MLCGMESGREVEWQVCLEEQEEWRVLLWSLYSSTVRPLSWSRALRPCQYHPLAAVVRSNAQYSEPASWSSPGYDDHTSSVLRSTCKKSIGHPDTTLIPPHMWDPLAAVVRKRCSQDWLAGCPFRREDRMSELRRTHRHEVYHTWHYCVLTYSAR